MLQGYSIDSFPDSLLLAVTSASNWEDGRATFCRYSKGVQTARFDETVAPEKGVVSICFFPLLLEEDYHLTIVSFTWVEITK